MATSLLDSWCRALSDDPAWDAPASAPARPRPEAAHDPASLAAIRSDDGERVERLRAGDVAELEALFHELTPALLRFAERTGVGRADADDIVLDVFYDFWTRRAALAPATRVRPYLYAAVRHRALNMRRAERRSTHRQDVVADDVAVREALQAQLPSDPEHAVERDEEAERVWRAARALPDGQRTALELRFSHELSLAEIAEVMQISVPAVKMALQRAIHSLRERLHGVFDPL